MALPYQYNANPTPQSGTDAFGMVPGQIALPNPAGDLSNVYPNLTGTNAAASEALLSKLSGQLSPGTINTIQDAAARYGVRSGMPGSNAVPGSIPYNLNLATLGLTSEGQTQQGLQDYSSLIPTVSQTQTVQPGLQAEIAATNAVNAAAPNPGAAQSYAQQLYDKYLASMSSPAGGTVNMSNVQGFQPLQPSQRDWGYGTFLQEGQDAGYFDY